MNEYRLRQKHKKSNLEVEQWTVYSIADLMVATIIVVVTMCNAEPSRFRHFQRQVVQTPPETAPAPYPPSGYRPDGPAFNPDQAPEATTTELPETTTTADEEVATLEPQSENIKLDERNRPVFLVVPQINRKQPIKSQSYISYVQSYPETVKVVKDLSEEPEIVQVDDEEVVPVNAAFYSSKLQVVPISNVGSYYNPYAYFQIYQ